MKKLEIKIMEIPMKCPNIQIGGFSIINRDIRNRKGEACH
jgi:hypothetical protein